ncbi:MAG: DUF3822 family protein [Ginsengibacter sp.]
MKSVFEILPNAIDAGKCSLVCEVSNEGFSYLIKDSQTDTFTGLGVYHYNTIVPGNHVTELQKILTKQELASENFLKVNVIYSFSESVLIPFSLYSSRNNAEALSMIHGDFTPGDVILTDVLLDKKVYNCYRMSPEITREIGNKFPSVEALHQYSFLIKNLSPKGNKLSVIFYPQKIVVTAEKEGELILINTFHYKTPEDVSYTLLNICRQLEIKNMPLQVSGLIEKDSALFKEIYKYFDPVSFTGLPEGTKFSEEMNEYPAHFFSHLFAINS